ncbi:MAG TPA: 50S ribosomal protein L13 [Nitriliruptorales bacterium]
MRTYQPSAKDIQREWFVVDAEDEILGRLATRIAQVLRGKHKPTFVPYLDGGDHVIVVNAAKVRLSGQKELAKVYHRHSGYPGGLTSVPFMQLRDDSPERIVERAVKGMLPKNKLGQQMITKLKIYAGPEHPHEAQQPKTLP